MLDQTNEEVSVGNRMSERPDNCVGSKVQSLKHRVAVVTPIYKGDE